jgi:hypothetical protein
MHITFTSTLTSEDENELAKLLIPALKTILDLFPVAYRIRIDTSDGQSYQSTHPAGGIGLVPNTPLALVKFVPSDTGNA